MRNSNDFLLACPAPKATGKRFLTALLIGTTLCIPQVGWAQNTDIGKELYNTPLQAPISGGTTNSRAQYIIPGTRPVSGNAELPSPKRLKRPEDLPSITLPHSAAPSRVAAPSRGASGSVLPAYPRALPSASPTFSEGVVKVVPPVIIESPMYETVVETAPAPLPQAIPFGKASAPIAPAPIVSAPIVSAPTPLPVAPLPVAPVPAPKPVTPKPDIVEAPAVAQLEKRIIPAPQPERIQPTPAPAPVAAVTLLEPITPLAETEGAPLPWQNKDVAPPAVEEVVIVTPEPVQPVIVEPALAEPVLVPQTFDEVAPAESAPVTIVTPVPAPELSEKSRFILDQTPKGIAPKKEVIARSPKPVIIKRVDPKAGNIPTLDVRAHEEMGMKIEVRKSNPNLNAYLEEGYANLIAGRYQIAAGYYEEVLKTEPRNEMAMFGLGTTYQKLGRTEEARDTYAKLLSYNPTHLEALNNFMALISDEAPDEAIAELERMELESPDFSPIPAQIGIIHSKQGNYAAAAEKLARALNLSPENNAYKYNLAIALDKLGQGEKASEFYLQLIAANNAGEIIPGDAETIRNRVIFLSQKRQ